MFGINYNCIFKNLNSTLLSKQFLILSYNNLATFGVIFAIKDITTLNYENSSNLKPIFINLQNNMKTLIIFISVSLLSLGSFSPKEAGVFIGKGNIDFTSDAPLELIKASSTKLTGVLDTDTRQFFFKAKIKSFKGFNSALQQEHFNENYMESDKYPKASFKGRIIEDIDFASPGIYKVRAKGKLTIHGISQRRIIRCTLKVGRSGLSITSNFNVPLEEHEITIPSIVNQKIASEIRVKISAVLNKK